MSMRISFSILALAIVMTGTAFGQATFAEGQGEIEHMRLVRVDVSNGEAVTTLKRTLRAWDEAGTVDPGKSLDLVVDEAEYRALQASGIGLEVVLEDLAQTNDGLRASYPTFSQLFSDMTSLASNHSNIASMFSIGESYEGRNIWCIEISDNPGVDEGEVGIVIMGCHHAREWPTVVVPYEFASRLTSEYGTDATITDLVNNHRIWIIPCVNPDGYYYSHDQGVTYWRKNRRPVGGGEYGVDLNRNYDGASNGDPAGEWGSIGTGSQSHNQSQDTYVGPTPFSELETQAVRDFFNARDVTLSISYHTYSELVLWPWGHDGNSQTDDNALMVSIGQGMAARITQQDGFGTYTPQQSSALYPTTGDSDSWIYGYRYYEQGKNTLAFTVEMGQSFQPAQGTTLDQIVDENWDGALYAMQQAASAEAQMTPFVLPPLLSAPTVDADGDFTVSWMQKNADAGADLYELQELTGLAKLTDGAEAGLGNWTNELFATSTARKHSGTRSFKSPTGDERIAAMTSTDPLPVKSGDTFEFWTWYDIETDWDMAFVEVSIDGLSFDVLETYTGSSGGWVAKSYSLDAYAGRSVYLRFRYTTDTSVTEEGFYVDDITPVAAWSSISTLSSGIAGTSYPITGKSDGDYFYRVRGSNPERGFGQFSDLGMTRVMTGFADSNSDGSRDLQDFATFQQCFGGDGASVPTGCPVPVDVFDFDLDEDIDLTDLAVIVDCLGGPGQATPGSCPL